VEKEQALELLAEALARCEGIAELHKAGIDVYRLQERLEGAGLVTDDEIRRLDNIGQAAHILVEEVGVEREDFLVSYPRTRPEPEWRPRR